MKTKLFDNIALNYKPNYKKEPLVRDAGIVLHPLEVKKIKYINKVNIYIGVSHPGKVQK